MNLALLIGVAILIVCFTFGIDLDHFIAAGNVHIRLRFHSD